MSNPSALELLLQLENVLQGCVVELRMQLERASRPTQASSYLLLAKAQERLATVQSAIIDILQKRITTTPPSATTVGATRELIAQLQGTMGSVTRFDSTLALMSDLFKLVQRVLVEPRTGEVAEGSEPFVTKRAYC